MELRDRDEMRCEGLATYTKTNKTGNGSSMRQVDEARGTFRHLLRGDFE